MHGTLSRAIGPQMRGAGRVRQQELLSHFRYEYNDERSHEGLGRQTPASRFVASTRPGTKILLPIHYQDDQQLGATQRRDQVQGAGDPRCRPVGDPPVGLGEVDNGRFEVRICEHLLGYLDLNKGCLEKATQWHLPDEENV